MQLVVEELLVEELVLKDLPGRGSVPRLQLLSWRSRRLRLVVEELLVEELVVAPC